MYQRRYRGQSLRAVPSPPAESAPAEQTGPPAADAIVFRRIEPSTAVVEAVQRQVDELGAAESRPGASAIALKLAELLDNPLALPQHPAAAGRLVELLGQLAKDRPRRGRLTAVRDMTR